MTALEKIHETDPAGLQTLERFAQAGNFNRWLFNTIAPHCRGHVLETGSGIGNLSKFFLEKKFTFTASDLRSEYCDILRKKFGNYPNLAGVESIDLAEPNFTKRYPQLVGKFDTVVSLNVIEHIADNDLAVHNCKQLLTPGGHFIILVPAYPALYNQFDEELGHVVRYTNRTLRQLLQGQGLEVVHQQHFNAAGIAGWMVNGLFPHRKLIPRRQLQFFNKLVPVLKLIDTITFHAIGLSVIAVGRKPNQTT